MILITEKRINKIIKYLVLSDIHLANTRNKTETIVEHLNIYFKENLKVFKKLDIIFLAGDVFDKLMHHYSNDSIESTNWLSSLCRFCMANTIKLRILEGTSSHDWKQIKTFYTAVSSLSTELDFKYIDAVSIEEIKDLGLSVLYVPDEWRPKTEDTFSDVKKELLSHNLHQVDIAIMHGQFNYQMPDIANIPKHNEEDYLSIVKYYINIGHVHVHSVYDRIIAQGSFDRICHGEEEKKGGVLITINPETGGSYRFIENKEATTFKTIEVTTKKIESSKKLIMNHLSKLTYPSHLRLIISKDNPIRSSIKEIRKLNPLVVVTVKDEKKDEREMSLVIDDKVFDTNDLLAITKDNIVELIMEESKEELIGDESILLEKELIKIVS